jgi:hypothetical protein
MLSLCVHGALRSRGHLMPLPTPPEQRVDGPSASDVLKRFSAGAEDVDILAAGLVRCIPERRHSLGGASGVKGFSLTEELGNNYSNHHYLGLMV